MTDMSNLPENLRRAGVAWVVSESASNDVTDQDTHRTHIRAHHWAIMRGMEIGTEEAYAAAVADAIAYRENHAQDVQAFLSVRERRDGAGS
jgi:hypothetical protein